MPNPLRLGIFGALQDVEQRRAQRADATEKRTLEEALRRDRAEDRKRTLEDRLYEQSQRPAREAALAATTARTTREANEPYPAGPRVPNVTSPTGERVPDVPGAHVALPTPKVPAKRALPAAQVEKQALIEQQVAESKALATDFAAAIKAGVNATGRLGGLVPTQSWMKNLVSMGGDAGGALRDRIAALNSFIGNALSGAAISPSEAERLQRWVPSENDNERDVLRKLNSFHRTMNEIAVAKRKAFAAYGYGGPGEPVAGADAPDDDEEYQQFLRDTGRVP